MKSPVAMEDVVPSKPEEKTEKKHEERNIYTGTPSSHL